MSDAVDDDTLQALQGAWKSDNATLPKLFATQPRAGRLKDERGVQLAMPYATVASEPDAGKVKRLAGPAGVRIDARKVTLTAWGVKADAVAALKAMLAVFGTQTTLTYPSGARFMALVPETGGQLKQDESTRAGKDIWQAILVATVYSVRFDT